MVLLDLLLSTSYGTVFMVGLIAFFHGWPSRSYHRLGVYYRLRKLVRGLMQSAYEKVVTGTA